MAKQLRANGIDVNQLSTVREASVLNHRHIRTLCIRYLASMGEDVVQYLDDKDLRVRVEVAKLLVGTPGRDHGLSRMIRDFNSLTSNGMANNREKFLDLRSQITGDRSLINALEVGNVLAMYGDNRALNLAQFAAEEGQLDAQRYRAIWLLETVLKSENTRAKMGFPPKSNISAEIKDVLMRCAGNEQSEFVQKQLLASMVRVNGNDAIDVLSLIESSERFPKVQKQARRAIQKIKEANTPPSDTLK